MDLKRKWAVIAGSVVVAGSLLTGAAFAASGATGTGTGTTTDQTSGVEKAVQSGKLTQGQADVLKQVGELRKTAMEKLKTDSKALVDQAVKDGKITQAQADKMQQFGHDGKHGNHDRRGEFGKRDHFDDLTPEQVKAKLDAQVKSGKLSQERADQMLKKFTEHQAQEQNKAK